MELRSVALTALFGTALAGCGGGSSGDANIPESAATPAPPAAAKLMLRGAVTDDPIDSASVVYHVGDRVFSAGRISDVNGDFEVEIEYDSLDDVVYGEATRGANGIHFIGDVMTVRDLLARAHDGVVDSGRITNVTTAKFVLARNATDDGRFDSFDDFASATHGVDAGELLDVSAAIKAVVESIDGVILPSDIEDTLQLAERLASGTTTFVEDLNEVAPGAMDAARRKLLSDGFATEDFSADAVPAVYTSTSGALAFAFFDDGSGLATDFSDAPVARISRWTVNADGDLEIRYADDPARVEIVQILAGTGDVYALNVKRGGDDPQQDVAPSVESFQALGFSGAFSTATAVGRYSTPNGVAFELNAGGTGLKFDTSGTVAGTLRWAVDGDGRLVLDFGDGTLSTLTRLASDAGIRVLSLDVRRGGVMDRFEVLEFTQS
ncbi:MAG: hypothetical protein AAFU65_07980 [Pseudomonadota bacterium]